MNIVQCLHVQKKYKKTRRMFLKDLELLALQFCRKQFDLIDCFLKKKNILFLFKYRKLNTNYLIYYFDQ